ncbi:hypothetical protein BDZ85DRAFT_284079 [Elsinoe ampelina]|uniref:Rhodopsin domain-containing protein n=1 Tax=Elsinoe ampelina TaxID=302913 RepID=A0A6A6G6E6_9PEZI|nr:hypothetical protein BDZ85DRAFT_284079 [Elsinoe ampelina]
MSSSTTSTATLAPPNPYGGAGPMLMSLIITLASIATFLMILRAYSASKTAGKWRMDFIMAAIGFAFGLASATTMIIALLQGLGNHVANLTFPQIFQALRWVWISVYTSLPAAIFAKYSIIALLLQIQGKTAKKRSIALYIMGALIGISATVQFFLSLFQCEPLSKLWFPYLDGSCPRLKLAGDWSYFQGALAALTDISLALWPISIVWNLQTSFRIKLGVCSLMAVGVIPTIGVILRMKMLPYIAHSDDLTYDFSHFMLWGTLELWLVIILSSLPPLRPLFLRVFYGIRSATGSYGRGTQAVTAGATNRGTHNGTVNGNVNEMSAMSAAKHKQGITVGTHHVVNDGASDEESLVGSSSGVGGITMTRDIHQVVEADGLEKAAEMP